MSMIERNECVMRTKAERNFISSIKTRMRITLLQDSYVGDIPVCEVQDVEQVKRVVMKLSFFHRKREFLNYLISKIYVRKPLFRDPVSTMYIAWLCIPKDPDSEMRSGLLPKKSSFNPLKDPVNYNLYDYSNMKSTPLAICYYKMNLSDSYMEHIQKHMIHLFQEKREIPDTIKIDYLDITDDSCHIWDDEEERFTPYEDDGLKVILV